MSAITRTAICLGLPKTIMETARRQAVCITTSLLEITPLEMYLENLKAHPNSQAIMLVGLEPPKESISQTSQISRSNNPAFQLQMAVNPSMPPNTMTMIKAIIINKSMLRAAVKLWLG